MRRDKASIDKLDARLETLERLRKRLLNESKPDPDDPNVGHVGDMQSDYPLTCIAMHSHLMQGGPERGATLTLWGNEDGLGGVFSIPSLGVKMFLTSGSLREALEQIEGALGDPDYKWKRETGRRKPQRNSYGKSTGRS